MIIYQRPVDAELAELELRMSELAMVEELTSKAVHPVPADQVSIRSLYSLAIGGEMPEAKSLESVLAIGPTTRAVYQRLLRTLALFYFPSVRAASTEWAPHREVAGCKIDLDRDDDQLFVTVELATDTERLPKSLTVINTAGQIRRVPLPEALRGVIHFPIVEDDDLVTLLADPDSEVYLA